MPQRILAYLRQNAIALLALFIALGGASYAAIKVPAHSVGTKQLRNGAVTSKKLAKHSVTASKLDPNSIAGHIADWAQISSTGQVISSSPQASVRMEGPNRGLFDVSWHRAIPVSGCIALANPQDNGPLAASSANTFGLSGGSSTQVEVHTFDGSGNNVPETVNVVVICP